MPTSPAISSRSPCQRKATLSRAVTGDVDDMQPAGDWQRFSICHVAIDPNRFHPLLRTPHEAVRGPRQQARDRVHGAEGASSACM